MRILRSLKALYSSVASAVGTWWGGGYNAVDPRRKLIEKLVAANRASANDLLSGALPTLRSYCRHLERNNPTARAAVEGLRACVVGTGIALEPKGAGADRIRGAWQRWIKCCGINGESLYELQRMGFGEITTAGEIVWRYIVLPELADKGEIPLRIVALDSEWLVDEATVLAGGVTCVAGIDLDRWGRPVAYRLRNPSVGGDGNAELVPAAEINHRFERRRPLQNRGEPWFAPVIETLMNERDLVDVELYAAKQSAGPAIVIESDYHEPPDTTVYGSTEDPVTTVAVGAVTRIYPGEKMHAHSHTRPSQQIAPFRGMLRGDAAGCLRLSQRWFDRDVRGANYSSMKADQIDSGMLLAPVREWYGHATAADAYKHVLPWIALTLGISLAQDFEYELIPDETPFLDPQKDIGGALLSIAGGLSTWEKEIGKRGGDAKAVLAQLKLELSDPLLKQIFMANLDAPTPGRPPGGAAAAPAAEPAVAKGESNVE